MKKLLILIALSGAILCMQAMDNQDTNHPTQDNDDPKTKKILKKLPKHLSRI